MLTEETTVIRRWTEICQTLYNYGQRSDMSKLDYATHTNRDMEKHSYLKDKVEEAVITMKGSK